MLHPMLRTLIPLLLFVLIVTTALTNGGRILEWHSAFRSSEFNALAAWASFYGLGISIAGILISGYAALGIRQIKTRFASKARLPVLRKSLQENASVLLDIAKETSADILPQKTELFSSIAANLNALERHTPKKLKGVRKDTANAVRKLVVQSKKLPSSAMGELEIYWVVYEKLQLLNNEIDHYLEDEKWEGS
ncbi:MAG: hypothetical protein QM576_15840 [Rhodopseudomonas sp.]|uniref:hypothetical protein n=1 Tax=Rhodopseudomonas sp. TaxID=1078 RepID=UPI0039E6EAE8